MLVHRLERLVARAWQRLRPAPRETGPASPALAARVFGTAPLLERILQENLIAFWYPRCIDERWGGYLLHHDASGSYKGPANKRLVAQARTLWFFARLARSGRMVEQSLAAARHGFDFLASGMWDRQYGGFFWETDPEGIRPTVSHKYLLAQTFPLYALSEYAMASGDAPAARLADDTFRIMEEQLYDPEHGGYWDRLTADWQPRGLPPTLTRSPEGLKTMDNHVHALEGVTSYLEASGDASARVRLDELLRIETRNVFRKEWGACSAVHRADWSPVLDSSSARANYGHDLENIMLVIAACRTAGIRPETHRDFFRTVFLSALRWGYDHQHGGFYKEGPLGGPAQDRSKSWWVQAEALLAALEMFRMTGDAVYAGCYLGTLEWIVTRHVDWQHGEWHAEGIPPGHPAMDKAGPWKDPYHAGRAMLRCLELLRV